MGKRKYSNVMGSWKILGEAEIKTIPKLEKSEFPYYGKGMKNTNIPKLWFFLDTSIELENHFIPKTG